MSPSVCRYGAASFVRLLNVTWASAAAALLTGALASCWVAATIWASIGASAALALAMRASREATAPCVLYWR